MLSADEQRETDAELDKRLQEELDSVSVVENTDTLTDTNIEVAEKPSPGIIITMLINPFTPTYDLSWIYNNKWKSPLQLLSAERVKVIVMDRTVSSVMLKTIRMLLLHC